MVIRNHGHSSDFLINNEFQNNICPIKGHVSQNKIYFG